MSRRPTRSPPPETLLRTTGHAIFTIAADFILRRNYDAVDHVLNNGLLKLFDSSPILVFRILGEVCRFTFRLYISIDVFYRQCVLLYPIPFIFFPLIRFYWRASFLQNH